MGEWEELLERLETVVAELDELGGPERDRALALLDGIDAVHRLALGRLGSLLDEATLERLRAEPAVAWLLDAYGVGVDERGTVQRALDSVRPYVHSHGGRVDLLDVADGVVRLRLAGACAGCSASAITLREGVERALREGFPAFARLEVEEVEAPAHEPPGPTLLQIGGLERG